MAVFTPVSLAQAEAFFAPYKLGRLRLFAPIAQGVENTNYKVKLEGGDFVLTLFEKRIRPQDLPFYMALTRHLADQDVPAPAPQRREDGEVIGALNGRPAALITWLTGRDVRAPGPSLQTTGGAMLARIHRATDDFPYTLENRFSLSGWRELMNLCANMAENSPHAALAAELSTELAELAALWPNGLPSGAIHGDYFPDNVLFDGDQIGGVIDYYFACTDMRAYDLAIALTAWCFNLDGALLPGAMAAFLEGYESERPLSTAERDALPTLCRGAALRFTLTRLHDVLHHDPSWLVTPKDPLAYHRRLKAFRASPRPWEDETEALALV